MKCTELLKNMKNVNTCTNTNCCNMTMKQSLLLYKETLVDIIHRLKFKWEMYYYEVIKPIFKPKHSRLRKAIPRTWSDITSLIEIVNFEMIKSFYEDEYVNGLVDWEESGEGHRKFALWLEAAYSYLTKERPELQIKMENSYPPLRPFNEMFKEEPIDEHGRKTYRLVDDGIPYEVKYKDVIKYTEEIKKKDTELLCKMIEYREYFWT